VARGSVRGPVEAQKSVRSRPRLFGFPAGRRREVCRYVARFQTLRAVPAHGGVVSQVNPIGSGFQETAVWVRTKEYLRTDNASLTFFRQRIAYLLSPRAASASLRLVAVAHAVRDTWALARSGSSAVHVREPTPATLWATPTNCRGNIPSGCPITGLRRPPPETRSSDGVGRNRHESASKVSAPTDIQGGDAVADERPSGVSDALSVRKYSVADRQLIVDGFPPAHR
jgi:hypothetical protein